MLSKAAQRGVKITFVTRDPLTESPVLRGNAAYSWYKGLKSLADYDGVDVLVHKSLHAKVYLIKSTDDRVFYSVGSSNLTYQGMGFRWAECNVLGYSVSEYREVEKEVNRIIVSPDTSDLQGWVRYASKQPVGLPFFKSAG